MVCAMHVAGPNHVAAQAHGAPHHPQRPAHGQKLEHAGGFEPLQFRKADGETRPPAEAKPAASPETTHETRHERPAPRRAGSVLDIRV
jgi:hypothetical protein